MFLLATSLKVDGRTFGTLEGDEEFAVRVRPSQKGQAGADAVDSFLGGGLPGESFIVKRILSETRSLREKKNTSNENVTATSNPPPPHKTKKSTKIPPPKSSEKPPPPLPHKTVTIKKSSGLSVIGPLAVVGIAAAFLVGIIAVAISIYLCCTARSHHAQYEIADTTKKLNDAGSPVGKNGVVHFHVAELDDASGFTDISLSTPRSPQPDWGVKKGGKGWFAAMGWTSGEVVPIPSAETLEKGVDRDPSVPIHMYSYRDLQKATKSFTTQIGNGSSGPVYKALFSTGLEAVVKVMDKMATMSEQDFQSEVVHLGRLHHPHLVNLLGFCTDRGHKMLVYEYTANGSLQDRLQDQEKPSLKWADRVRILKEVAFGIHYLHDENQPAVLHRDIRTSNVLLDTDMSARVADFGLTGATATEVAAKTGGFKGPPGYVDPEFLLTGVYTDKSDVYSFGVLMFEVMAGRTPQQGLVEYINLATMGEEGKERWSIIVDPRLEGRYLKDELTAIAAISHKCMRKSNRRRPKISEVVEALSLVGPPMIPNPSPTSLPVTKPIAGRRTPSWESTAVTPTAPASIQSFASFQRTHSNSGVSGSLASSAAAALAAVASDEAKSDGSGKIGENVKSTKR